MLKNVFANQSALPGSHFAIMAPEEWEREAKSSRRRPRRCSGNNGKERGWLKKKGVEKGVPGSKAYGWCCPFSEKNVPRTNWSESGSEREAFALYLLWLLKGDRYVHHEQHPGFSTTSHVSGPAASRPPSHRHSCNKLGCTSIIHLGAREEDSESLRF